MDPIVDPGIAGLDWTPNFNLAPATSIGIGGVASAGVTAHSEEALGRLLQTAHAAGWRVWLLGGGSNTIFCGPRFEGVVVKLGREFAKVRILEEGRLEAGAAALWSAAVKSAERSCLSGFEFGAGIPGTIGGALAGNAGQQGESICDLVESVSGFTREGQPVILRRGEFAYTYRRSDLKQFALTGARFVLQPSEPEAIKARMQRFLSKRWEQPLGVRSSGCIFKNPEGEAAGRLIDLAGLKGCSIGDAAVAEEHANFILNRRAASAQEVLELIDHIRETVRTRFDVELELEVQLAR